MAYLPYTYGGFIYLHISSILEAKIVLKWSERLLYIQLFISLLVLSGNWNNPQTFAYIGSVVCLVFSALFFIKDEEGEITESNGRAELRKISEEK